MRSGLQSDMSNRIIKTIAPLFGAVIFFIGSFVAAAQTPGIFEENRYRAAGCHAPYEAPAFHDTPAPEGYKPFYVSHFGRHGSRFQTGTSVYEAVLPFLDSMAVSKNLTPEGESLRKELHHILEATFKAAGHALRKAVCVDWAFAQEVPSTKGTLS